MGDTDLSTDYLRKVRYRDCRKRNADSLVAVGQSLAVTWHLDIASRRDSHLPISLSFEGPPAVLGDLGADVGRPSRGQRVSSTTSTTPHLLRAQLTCSPDYIKKEADAVSSSALPHTHPHHTRPSVSILRMPRQPIHRKDSGLGTLCGHLFKCFHYRFSYRTGVPRR